MEGEEDGPDWMMEPVAGAGGKLLGGGGVDRKKRFSEEQIKSLESMFATQTKLEPRQKLQLARELGLQPRQVAIWFQNKRARWKSKQLERDYAALRQSYDALRLDHDVLRRDKDALVAEIKELKAKLMDEEAAASFTSVKEEPAASDGPPPAGVGSSDSDSSAVLNDTGATGATPAADVPAPEGETLLGALAGAAVARHGDVFFHGNFLKVEEDETGFLDTDEPCRGFFADEPPLAWWTEPTEHWK